MPKIAQAFWVIVAFVAIFFIGCGKLETDPSGIDNVGLEITNEINPDSDPEVPDHGQERTGIRAEYTWKYVTIPRTVTINSITNSGDAFVAVGFESTSEYSPINAYAIIFASADEYGPWTPIYIDSVWSLNSVAWSGEQFVAVGHNGMIYISNDGYTWSNINSGTTRNLFDILWANNQYVAVGEFGATITSPDGINWDTKPVVVQSDLNKLVHNGSFFLAVGNDGAIVKSNDGNSWEAQELGIKRNFETLTWNGDYFMAVSRGAGYGTDPVIIKSKDGINWDITAFPYKINAINGLAWHNNIYVLASEKPFYADGGLITSKDGSNWEVVDEAEGHYKDVFWTGNNFVAAGWGVYSTSQDGVDWNDQHLAQYRVSQSFFGATWSENKFLAAMHYGYIWATDDFVKWQKFNPEGRRYDLYNLYDVAWSGEHFVAVGNWGEIFISENGWEWTPCVSGTEMDILSVKWIGNQFVAVGHSRQYGDDMNILTSTDGRSWILRPSGTTEALNEVVQYNDRLIAVGNKGTILTSPDGNSWVHLDSPTNQELKSITVGPHGQLVAVGYKIINSSDGVDWSLSTSPENFFGTINSVVWTGSQYIAVGDRGIMFRSIDGINWEQLPKVTRNDLYDLVLTASNLIATGQYGIILRAD